MQSKYTNDFAIMVSHALVHDNTINCGSGNNSCRGIHFGTPNFTFSAGKIYNNVIDVQELPRNQEYGGCEMNGAYGIQIEDSTNNVEIYGNTVTANSGACDAAAIRPSVNTTNTGIYIHDNTFTAVTSGAGKAYAIRFEGVGNSVYSITNSVFRTNYAWLKSEADNTNVTFSNNRWETVGTLANPFHPFEMNPYDSVNALNDLTAIATFNGNTYGTGDQARFTSECWRSTYNIGSCLAGSSIIFTGYTVSNFYNLTANWLSQFTANISDLNSDSIVNTKDLGIMMSKWN